MAQYRKKQVVEAVQWWPPEDRRHQPIPAVIKRGGGVHWYSINTLEGPFQVSAGDWIVTGVRGEVYACKPDIFEATYEAVEE